VNGSAIGVYIGNGIDTASTASTILPRVIDELRKANAPSKAFAQLCGPERNAHQTFGIAIDTSLAGVQKSVATWNNGQCTNATGSTIGSIQELVFLETWRGSLLQPILQTEHSLAMARPIGNGILA
jgi:hypothetical protein